MFLDDAFQHRRCAGVIPHTLGIDDGDRPLGADSQAICLGAIHQRFRAGQLQLLQPSLKVFPGFQARFPGSTFGLRLVGAQENMAPVFFEPKRLRDSFKFAGHLGLDAARALFRPLLNPGANESDLLLG